jgi:uncharacterized protein
MNEESRDAGSFGDWADQMLEAIRNEGSSNVPCGTCTGCCTSSQFIHITPNDAASLESIPKELLFKAPRLPTGHMLLGYNDRGHCPMLVNNACSIYDTRPKTCRTYDCRIFVATRVAVDEPNRSAIAEAVSKWTFTYLSVEDETRHAAARRAASFLRESTEVDSALLNPTQLAVMAFMIHDLFFDPISLALRVPDISDVRSRIDSKACPSGSK